MLNKKIILAMVLLALLSILLLLFLFDNLVRVNDISYFLSCKKTLKAISHAIGSYQAEWDGAYPPSLLELKPHIEEKYKRGPNGIPNCPGCRDDATETSSSWDYIYQAPLIDSVVKPICWDSKPHPSRGAWTVCSPKRNILFSDGHIETIKEQKFIQFMQKYSIDQWNKDHTPDTLNSGDY